MRVLTLSVSLVLASVALLSTATAAPLASANPPAPIAAGASNGPPALCVAGVYNNQHGPSSGCDGIACLGYSNEDWERCVLDCTTCIVAGGVAIDLAVLFPEAPDLDARAAICLAGDVYNTGSLPCAGLACYGQTQYGWQHCVGNPVCLPPRCHIPPPMETLESNTDQQVALCVYGDAYNTGGRPCQGVVCVGYTMGQWVNCYPRLPPCWACPPPPARQS